MPTPCWNDAHNILCVRLDSLGDVLMTTPAMRAVKQSGSGRRVTLLTSPAGAALDGMLPDVDETIVYQAPWMKSTPARTESSFDLEMMSRLRDMKFDAAIIFTVFSQNPLPAALLCYLAGIPLRLAHCRENPYQLLTDWVAETEPDKQLRHEVRRQLDLVAAIDCRTPNENLAMEPLTCARSTVARMLEQYALSVDDRWIVVHPGASAPSRRYPPELFAAAAKRLVEQYGVTIVFTGSPQEVSLVESIRAAMEAPSLSLAGALNLAELAALIEAAPLLLTNNTGPAHLAAALRTPVVDLYALTNPQHTPWQAPQRVLYHDVPCKYCFRSVCPLEHHACLRELKPAIVAQAVDALLTETAAAQQPTRSLSPPPTSPATDTPVLAWGV